MASPEASKLHTWAKHGPIVEAGLEVCPRRSSCSPASLTSRRSGPMEALHPLLELGVDVKGHLGVGVTDLVMTHLTSKLFASRAIEM